MKPGAQDNSTVQLATGTVSFPVRLFSLAGRNGLDFDLAISYNSGGIRKVADTSNLEAPTGLLGLGWSLPKEAIIRNTNSTGTSEDNVYYLLSGGNLYPLFRISLPEMIEGETYECENYNFWQIRYQRNRELWTVTKENGDRYSYGGELPASVESSRSSAGNSIEWGVKWKNWIGPSDVAVGQEQFPILWNLASIENIWNERVSLEYDQTQRMTGTLSSPLRRRFTKSCRLSRVTGACGESIVLKYKEKQPLEYQWPDNPPLAAHNNVVRIVGTLATRFWFPLRDPRPRVTVSVTGKNGFTQDFIAGPETTSNLAFNFDLHSDAPDTLDIEFRAENVPDIGDDETILSGRFADVVANGGIVQRDYSRNRRHAALKLRYVREQPTATDDADIYQHRQETQYLASMELYSADGVKTEQAELGYRILGSVAIMQKRVLASITHGIRATHGSYQPSSPNHLFEYYGESQGDGVGGITDALSLLNNEDIGNYSTPRYDYGLFNSSSGALYGALKSFTSPEGSKTSYRYQELTIDQARRELEIKRPQDDSPAWQGVDTYFGLDYVVVIWKGSNEKAGQVYASVYQWHGRWVATDLGELRTGVNGALHIEVAAEFFAIVAPGHAESVRLFSPNKLRPGQWDSYVPSYTSSEKVTPASGRNFLALLDTNVSGGYAYLHRFTRDGDAWRVEWSEPIGGGTDSVLAIAARDNFIVTARARADNSSLPELRLYYLDELRNWWLRSLQVHEHFFEKNGYQWDADSEADKTWSLTSHGVKALELYAGETFILLQAACDVAHRTTIFGDEEYFEAYRHFIFRWPEDYARLELEFEPCLDVVNKGVAWDCVKRHNNEVVIERKAGAVRPSVVGDQIIIDVWEDIPLTDRIASKAKQKKFVYQYSGCGWYEEIFDNDQLQNNYVGQNSCSTTEAGRAQYREFNPSKHGWQTGMPAYRDGNPSLFEKLVWPIIRLVGGLVTLPLPFGPGLLVDILFLNVDALIEAMTKLGGAGRGTDQFFSADFTFNSNRQSNLVYHRSSTGLWTPIGDLTPDAYIGVKTGAMSGTATVFEDLKLDHRSTQFAENAIIFALEREQYGKYVYLPLTQQGHATQRGYPKYRSRVQLLKNGVFFKTIDLPEGELVRRTAQDTSLSGANAFFTFKGNPVPLEPTVGLNRMRFGESVQEAISLKLYRVINDDIQGPLTDFVVSQVTVNDGYSNTNTHYSYDTASASIAPAGAGALYGKVTTTYSGASPVLDQSNGFTESLFHGSQAAAGGASQESPDDESVLYKGLLYQTTICNFSGTPVAINKTRWKAFSKKLTSTRTGHFVRSIATTAMIDGATKLTEVDYAIGAETAIGTPVNVRKVHFDAAGKLVTTVHALTYGWQKYPALLAPNILTPVVETRTHVNEILTQASATTWGPANATMRWAPLATYMAKRSTGPFDFVQPANNLDWQASSIILARSVFGVVAETQDVGGIVHSVVYDKHDRLPVATFVHASVERHEAGYCGFEPYEQSAPPNSSNGVLTNSADPEESGSWNDEVWQINGSPEQNAHTGIGALSGSPARIEPQCFAPRSKQTSYVVSAWVKPRIGGRGGQIGFGSQSKTITFVNADTWQFVELMTESPHENEKPFVSCDGTIDDFRFGPLDAPFNATVYDPQYHLVTAKLDSNEGVVRMVYDHLRRPLATLGPDGQVVSLHSERLSRQAQQPFNPRQPNEALTLLPRKGGQYYSAFADYARLSNNSGHADPIPQGTNKGLRFRLVPQVHSNPGDSSEFVLQCGGASIKGSIAWEASGSSGRLVLNWPVITDSNQSPVVTDGDGNGVGPPVNLQSESSFKIGADCTVLLWLIDRDVYCFIDGTLSARHALSSSAAGALSLQWMPTGNAALVDLVSFYDPIVSSSFSDGLGRVIQTQHLADRGAETIAEQTLHDGWGHAAVQTKPIPVSRGLAYQDDLVSSFDWNSGVMRGRVADYYGQAEERVADQQPNDHQNPYLRQLAESSPLARIVESGGPGSEFTPGAPHALRHSFARTSQASELLTDLGLSSNAQHYLTLTTSRALDDTRSTTGVEIFDLQGNVVARRQGSGAAAITSTYGVEFTPDGTIANTKLPNAFSPEVSIQNHFIRTSVTNLRGLLEQSSDCDRGTQHYFYDRTGRLRFRRDPSGANDRAGRILYWKYDALGRVTEEGQTTWGRDNEALQAVADTAPERPAGSTAIPGDLTSSRKSYFYDISPNGGANLKGRLSRAVSRDEAGEEIEETYQYDLYGRVSAVGLRAPAFDAVIHTTTYRYDTQGNVIEIGYPTGTVGAVSIGTVHYSYTSGGRLAGIGTAGDPAFYGAYEYNVDGSIKTGWLNRRRIQRDYRYDFQGRLLEIVDRSPGQQPWFAEALNYRDASGRFKDGNIAEASFTGSGVSVPHRYTYEYDEHGRLLSAKAAALNPRTPPPGNWDVKGMDGKPIGYDANGNIVSITQGGTAYFYEAGTNRLAGTDEPLQGLVLSFEPGEAGRLHPWTRNPEFKENEWYCRNSMYEATTEIPLTKKDRHSGTQSLQLNDLLSSRLRASPQASRYVFKAWVKNNVRDARSPVSMQIAIPDGKVMVGKSIPYTEGEWWLFECAVESKDVAAGTVLQAALSNRAGGKVDPHFPVFVDEVFFGIDSADYIYDAKGCVIRGRHLRQLQYEPLTGLTREIQAELQSGSTRQTRTVKLQYGAQGRRVLKTAISRDSSESAGVRSIIDTVQTRLYLHGTNAYPLGEESKTSSTETLMGTVPSGIGYSQIGSAAYIYGIGGLLAMREGEQTYFFCKDHLGSVRVVLDHDSQVCAGFDYLPFGEPSNSPSTKRFHYLYTGQEFDSEIGLYNYRARMYDPRHGRFYAPDPAHQYASPYEYVGNNPINLVDRAGTKAQGLSALVRALSHGEDLWKALALGAGTGAIAGTFSEGISLIHYYSVHPELSAGPGEIFGKILIGTAVGAAGGVVGAGAGFFADLGISRGLLSVWLSRDSRLSQDLVRGFGVGRGLLSGSVSSLAAQLTSNIITAAQGQTVNWGVSLGAATGIGGVFGGVSGWFASTRMRVGGTWLKATTAKGVKPSRYKAVSDNDDYISARGRGWHDYIADTVGEQWGSSVSAGSGLLGGLAASALVEWS